jgi:hypothetical protein
MLGKTYCIISLYILFALLLAPVWWVRSYLHLSCWFHIMHHGYHKKRDLQSYSNPFLTGIWKTVIHSVLEFGRKFLLFNVIIRVKKMPKLRNICIKYIRMGFLSFFLFVHVTHTGSVRVWARVIRAASCYAIRLFQNDSASWNSGSGSATMQFSLKGQSHETFYKIITLNDRLGLNKGSPTVQF